MKIGLDLDGVIYPWHYSIYKYFKEYKEYNGSEVEFWANHRNEITDFHVSIPMLYLDTTPTQDVLTYVPKIAELGEIYYITSRNPDLMWATGKFFDLYNLPFKENIIFSSNKATYVRLNQIDYFLDDLPANVDSLMGITEVYLFKASHNVWARDRYNIMSTMREFYELLKEKA